MNLRGEACIAALELGNWLNCDLCEALSLLGQSSVLCGLSGAVSIAEVACQFLEAHLPHEVEFDVACLPGCCYAVGNGLNVFVEPGTTLAQLDTFFKGKPFKLYLRISGNAGEVLRGKIPGMTFWFNSKESGRHHEPHVHASYDHSFNFSISLVDGCVLAGEPEYRKVPGKVRRAIDDTFRQNQRVLLDAWNRLTDGITVDVDALLGQTDCSGLK